MSSRRVSPETEKPLVKSGDGRSAGKKTKRCGDFGGKTRDGGGHRQLYGSHTRTSRIRAKRCGIAPPAGKNIPRSAGWQKPLALRRSHHEHVAVHVHARNGRRTEIFGLDGLGA